MKEESKPDHKKALQKAIELMGGYTGAASLLGTTQQRVWNWLNRDRFLPAEFAPQIEELVHKEVTKNMLRPDVFSE